jgi:hypothetical protein
MPPVPDASVHDCSKKGLAGSSRSSREFLISLLTVDRVIKEK